LELQDRTESDLTALFAEVSTKLLRTPRDTPERRNGLASLENISPARCLRFIGPALDGAGIDACGFNRGNFEATLSRK
jgi:hypothetical protein